LESPGGQFEDAQGGSIMGPPTVLRPSGELDIAGAGDLVAAIDRECSEHHDLTIDLSALTFIDCAGLRVLLYASARTTSDGSTFRLIRGPERVQRLFRLTGVEARLPFGPLLTAVAEPVAVEPIAV
jgi:anti-anti-sigma factor